MKFNEKLKNLRHERGLTQAELARALFVSRTAVSKWESGRGYPGIDLLKAIASFFNVSVDMLVSESDELVTNRSPIAQRRPILSDLIFALLDISMILMLFAPFFAERSNDQIVGTSLLELSKIQPYLKTAFLVTTVFSVIIGILILTLRSFDLEIWDRNKNIISLCFNVYAALLFMLSLHPYAAAYSFAMLIIKAAAYIRARRHE